MRYTEVVGCEILLTAWSSLKAPSARYKSALAHFMPNGTPPRQAGTKQNKKKNALPSDYAYIAEVIAEDQTSVCYLFCRCTFALYE